MTHRSRTRTRSSVRVTRRRSPCYRHPDEPITGICASCLRERLSGLDSSPIATATSSPELRRCRSVVSVSKCGPVEPRRKSCDVVSARSSLSNLLDVDDLNRCESKVESRNVGLSGVTYTVIGSDRDGARFLGGGFGDGVRVSSGGLGRYDGKCFESDGEVEEGELKTMKDYIDLECRNKVKKGKDLRVIAGNLAGAASSVFSKKLRKWRLRNSGKANKGSDGKSVVGDDGSVKSFKDGKKLGESSFPVVSAGRRSCDTEPRFSVDGGRISFEEPRASWDGYMIARTIPRLAPMFSVVENGVLGSMSRFENHRLSVDGPMHSIIEDESSSGGSGHSNSDSSSSVRGGSSFDRSSSVRSFGKKGIGSEAHGVSPANVKLVITEKELKDWHLSSRRGGGSEKHVGISGSTGASTAATEGIVKNSSAPAKKSVRWRKVCNVLGFRNKNSESMTETIAGNAVDPFDDTSEKQGTEAGAHLKDVTSWKLTRSSSIVSSRHSCDVTGSNNRRRRSVDSAGGFGFKGMMEDFKMERNTGGRFSSAELAEDGIIPFYMTPLRGLRNGKSGKFNLPSSHPIAGNVLQHN